MKNIFRDSSKLCISWSTMLASDSYWMPEILVTTCSGLVMQAKGAGALGQQFGWIMRLRTESRSQNTTCRTQDHIMRQTYTLSLTFQYTATFVCIIWEYKWLYIEGNTYMQVYKKLQRCNVYGLFIRASQKWCSSISALHGTDRIMGHQWQSNQ